MSNGGQTAITVIAERLGGTSPSKTPYTICKVTLRGKQPKEFDLPISARYVLFMDTGGADTSKIEVAINDPTTFIELRQALYIKAEDGYVDKLYFKWDDSQTGKELKMYVTSVPTIIIVGLIEELLRSLINATSTGLSGLKTALETLSGYINTSTSTIYPIGFRTRSYIVDGTWVIGGDRYLAANGITVPINTTLVAARDSIIDSTGDISVEGTLVIMDGSEIRIMEV